jgi:uncharacterized membrane protein
MMTDPNAGGNPGQVRLRYKIIAYAAVWIIALLLTAPGMWPLAYLFPLGLIAVFDRHLANAGGWGIFVGCYVVYLIQVYLYFDPGVRRARLFSTRF